MKKIELLAPAGDMNSLYAAVQSGADAVYLGGDKFSARAYANNFDNENIKKAVRYCHLYNVKLYITVNTIMKENELREAVEYVKFLYSIGADAIIIQDIGLAMLIRKYFPGLALHASTQMTVHNLEAALFLKKVGFNRIVLSRELTLKEIENISKNIGVETEIFIHGALCVCYSGQCLMSSMIGGRSGNRGRCAQPCRLPYSIIDLQNGVSKRGYLLSPKDICTIEDIKCIINSGAVSLKIEGRMKRPEYVAGVVSEYRTVIDEYLNLSYENHVSKIDINKSKNKLLQLFNREGFSKAYLFKNTGRDMMSYSFPKNMGVELGKVHNDRTIILNECVSVGDGVRNNKDGFSISKIIKDNREVPYAEKGQRVRIMPMKYSSGDIIYKTSDLNQLKNLENIYKNPYKKKIELNLKIKFQTGKRIILQTIYGDHEFTAAGEKVQNAITTPISQNRIIENILKTGDTPFKFENIEFVDYEEGFLPISSINFVRRQLIDKIEKHILTHKQNKNNVSTCGIEKMYYKNGIDLPENIVVVTTTQQLRAALDLHFNCICINPFQHKNVIDLSDITEDADIYIKIPNIIKEEFDYICNYIEKNSRKIKGIITANLGIISKFSNKTNIIGDYKLNIFNSSTLDFYNGFTNGNCLSVELSGSEMKDLLRNSKCSTQVLIYGKIELMVSEYCVIGSTFGEKTISRECSKSCEVSDYSIKDRKNVKFPLETDKFCRGYIYNSVALNLIPYVKEIKNMGIKSFRLDFLDETYSETKAILKAFSLQKWQKGFTGFTRGSYKRGVE